VSKFPPSPSGVGLYARVFSQALDGVADVRIIRAPGVPTESQSLRSAIQGFRTGLALRSDSTDVVHVELSGRALYEFFVVIGLTTGSSRPRVAITCHDTPSIVGMPLLFACLDRRGLRRLGVSASRWLGPRLEMRVVRNSDAVFALTREGAAVLADMYGRHVSQLPHVTRSFGMNREPERFVFVPGYFSNAAAALDVLLSLAPYRDWTLAFGVCPDSVRDELTLRARDEAMETRVAFTGFLEEDELLEQFSRAAIVVRLARAPDVPNHLAASGPLAWALSFGCVVVTDDHGPGTVELAAQGLVTQTSALRATLAECVASPTTWTGRRARVDAVEALSGEAVVGRAYLAELGRVCSDRTRRLT
jgi:glycosyltransferase involved in cell wall biosynthesis